MALFSRSMGRGSAVLSLLLLILGVGEARADFATDLAVAAEKRANHRVVYDPKYVRIAYPKVTFRRIPGSAPTRWCGAIARSASTCSSWSTRT